MPSEALKRWRKAVGIIIVRKRLPSAPLGQTHVDPEVLEKLQQPHPEFVEEFQSYRYGKARDQHRVSVSSSNEGHNLHGKYIYVLSPDLRLYVQPEPAGVGGARQDAFRHSAFLAGAPILSAGQMYCWDGSLVLIDNSSGHYKPKPESMAYILNWLHKKGIPLEWALVSIYLGKSYIASDFRVHNIAAPSVHVDSVPDVENIFGFVDKQAQSGTYFGSFAEAQSEYRSAQELKQQKVLQLKMEREKQLKEQAEVRQKQEQAKKLEVERRAQLAEESRKKRELQREEMRRKIAASKSNQQPPDTNL